MRQLSLIVNGHCLVFKVLMYTLNMLLDILLRIILFSTDVTCEFLLLSLRINVEALSQKIDYFDDHRRRFLAVS